MPEPPPPAPQLSLATWFVRYGIGGILCVVAVVLLVLDPGGFGTEGFGMCAGSGLSVMLLNFLFRLGVSGDRERAQEEEARAYFDLHGRWPDEDEAAARPVRGGPRRGGPPRSGG
jgi:hypothetical protein